MPIYEYRCECCRQEEEVLQKASAPAPESCSHCGRKNGMRKVISQSSFALKGSGWYKDLYASPKPEPKACDKPSCGTEKAPCKAYS
ncbi:MAG: zinc ribbon domain-containing protein [Deltaproteobacteria bacterium]|nr:zinc ribbon domain-containing protein [Deltaproteobacteria bacterium]